MNNESKGYNRVTGLTFFNNKGDAVGREFSLAVVKNKQFTAVK